MKFLIFNMIHYNSFLQFWINCLLNCFVYICLRSKLHSNPDFLTKSGDPSSNPSRCTSLKITFQYRFTSYHSKRFSFNVFIKFMDLASILFYTHRFHNFHWIRYGTASVYSMAHGRPGTKLDANIKDSLAKKVAEQMFRSITLLNHVAVQAHFL